MLQVALFFAVFSTLGHFSNREPKFLSSQQIVYRYCSNRYIDFSSRFIDFNLFDTLPYGRELFLGRL